MAGVLLCIEKLKEKMRNLANQEKNSRANVFVLYNLLA